MRRRCEAADCDREVYARGYCPRHYKQVLRSGSVLPERAPQECAANGCERTAVTRGWCHGHYLRWSRTGDVQPDVPLQRPERGWCAVERCGRLRHARGLCTTHLDRLKALGDVRPEVPVRSPERGGWITHGYRGLVVPPELRHLVDGAKTVAEHRLVMAILLDRPLFPGETVHHRNGDRLDNRPENLELWSTAQPKGQRVQDKLAFAYELILRYDPEAAQELGLLRELL